MSQPDPLRDEFASYRDTTDARLRSVERDLREVRALARSDDAELARAKANTRLIEALRETQLEQGRTLDEHTRLLRLHGQTLNVLAASYIGLEEDVATLKTDVGALQTDVSALKTDVSTLKTDVGTLTSSVAGILRILDERLPPKA